MKTRLYLAFGLVLLSGSLVLQAQSTSQSGIGFDPSQTPQSTSTPCEDHPEACGLNLRPDDLENLRDPGQLEDRRSSRSAAAEDSRLNNPNVTGQSTQQRRQSAPDPPTEFQRFVAATSGQVLPIYGASLFRDVPSTFSPSDITPVTADYVIGPDDELRLRIWGEVTYSGNLRVDRSGDVYVEGVGSVHVAGLQFSALDQRMRSAVSRVYRNFDLSVDMGRIRSIQIYVTGQARRPGAYTISSLSSLVDAFFASGGPSVQGSLRHIQLRRNGKTVTDFDLYALLVQGDKSKDVRLLPEDVLYIPPVGNQVAIMGSIHNPAIYELLGSETVGDLIELAGRTTTVASDARISVERAADHQQREAMEVAADAAGRAVVLKDGDIVRVFSTVPSYKNTVTLRGNIANPGRFGWHAGMHLSDLIPDQDSLMSRDYWWKRSHLGLPSPEFEPVISRLGRDPRKPEYNRDGYTTSVSQETLSSALMANHRQDSANSAATRNDPRTDDSRPDDLRSDDAQTTDQQRNGMSGTSIGSSANEMSKPGETRNEPRSEIRIVAPEINWSYAVVERLNPQTLRTTLLPFDLGRLVISHDASQNLALEPGDTITVFSQADIRVPLEQQTKYVTLEGEFVHAGIYSALPGETLRDLVRRAGGLASKAYLYGSEFDRESTRILQQQRIDEYVNKVDLNAQRGSLALTASATSSAGSLASTAGARTAEQELISRLRQIRATGRIVLQIQAESKTIDDLPALDLENGDRFVVPSEPATVNVVGSVNDQNSFQYHPHGTAGEYLQLAGGTERDADRSHTFVIRADGSVISRQSVKGLWGNKFDDLHLHPGDTIVVPDKTLRPTALRGLLDWTQIFSQLAIGAAAVNILQ